MFRLVEAGKQLFVITNSPFETVDKGMSFMVGAGWRDLFDVIIVQVWPWHLALSVTGEIKMLKIKHENWKELDSMVEWALH